MLSKVDGVDVKDAVGLVKYDELLDDGGYVSGLRRRPVCRKGIAHVIAALGTKLLTETRSTTEMKRRYL